MGESLFGRGFGQIAADTTMMLGIEEKVWKLIPRSVFNGMSRRYQVNVTRNEFPRISSSVLIKPADTFQMVYIKRFLRKLGIDLRFDWPAEMIQVRRLHLT